MVTNEITEMTSSEIPSTYTSITKASVSREWPCLSSVSRTSPCLTDYMYPTDHDGDEHSEGERKTSSHE